MEGTTELTPPQVSISPTVLKSFEQRALTIHRAAPVMAKVDTKEKADDAARWINQVKNFEDEVEASEIAVARGVFFKFHAGLVRMCKQFTEPCKNDRDMVQAGIDKWGAEERRKANIQREKDEAKLKKEAEQRKLQDAARVEKLGKGPKAVNASLSRPIIYTPPPIALPKVKDMIWKKKYVVEVQDVRLFLKSIVDGGPDALINEDYVTIDTGKLEELAAQRDGKLPWPGLAIFESEKGQTQRRTA
jgi:hypothetical protein